MKNLTIAFLTFTIIMTSCKTLGELGLKPSHLENVMALKKILDSSTFKALKTLRNVNKDGIEGALPKEIQPVLKTLKALGYGDQVETLTKSIGNASGVMLQESEGIVKDAISELKFTDAVAVILGGENAATGVLKNAMYRTVKKRYSNMLENELGKTEALKYWPMAAGAYNMFSKNKVDSSLSDFLAERSVDALFLAIGKQESAARSDYKSIGNAVVTKVFDYYSKNKKRS
ncbi:MAG: DUF4197 family protein [Saprospiraceae bacterium]